MFDKSVQPVLFGAIPAPHPLGQLKLFELLQAILLASAKEGKRAAEVEARRLELAIAMLQWQDVALVGVGMGRFERQR